MLPAGGLSARPSSGSRRGSAARDGHSGVTGLLWLAGHWTVNMAELVHYSKYWNFLAAMTNGVIMAV